MKDIPISQVKLNGGLNTNGNPFYVNDAEGSDIDNIDFDKFGALIKRKGYYFLNSTALT